MKFFQDVGNINVLEFLKQHWYMVSAITITVIGFIVYACMFARKAGHQSTVDETCVNNLITEFQITNDQDDHCSLKKGRRPNDMIDIPMRDSEGNSVYNPNQDLSGVKTCVQFCYQSNSSLCDSTQVITDAKVVDMTAKDGSWKDRNDRCPDGYFPAFTSLIEPQYDGKIIVDDYKDCKHMGICLKADSWKIVKNNKEKALFNNGLLVSIVDKDKPPQCPSGWESNKIDMHTGCST